MRPPVRPLLVIALALLFCTPLAFGGDPENGPRNFDVRDDDAKASVIVKERHLDRHGPKQKVKKDKTQQEMKKAEKRMEREIPGLDVKHSKRTGAPEAVGVKQGRAKLHGPSGNRDQTLRKFLR